MSVPQHIGDLIMPCPFGHFETCTVLPSSFVSVSCTSSLPQLPQVMMPTLIPHVGQVYRDICDFFRSRVLGQSGWTPASVASRPGSGQIMRSAQSLILITSPPPAGTTYTAYFPSLPEWNAM